MRNRTFKKYYATQRRNRALLLALGGHVVAIIVILIWLSKSMIDQPEDSIVVDIISPKREEHSSSKKGGQELSQKKGEPAIQDREPRLDVVVSQRPSPIVETIAIDPPPDPTLDDHNLLPVPDPPEPNPLDIEIDDPTLEPSKGKDSNKSDSGSESLNDVTESDVPGQDPFNNSALDNLDHGANGTPDQFICKIEEEGDIVRGHISLLRLKHGISDWWQDPTAIPSLIKWLSDHRPSITADMKFAGGSLPLTDGRIMDAPLLIMTGHDQAMSISHRRLLDRNSQASGFNEVERAALREYILEHNGMLFFDYCGNGGNEKSFANLVAKELRIVFPEYPLTTLSIGHEIFQCYFKLERTPVGGSWFWGTGYKGGNNKWRYIKGISVPGRLGRDRLAVIFCPLDYLCSMETEAIDSRAPLSRRRYSDVYRFMANMFVYQMRQRAKNQ